MTVVAARKYKDKIVIACDSQISNWCNKDDATITKIQKSGDIVAGMAGQGSNCTLMATYMNRRSFSLPKKIDEMAITEFVVAFYNWCKEKCPIFNINPLGGHFLFVIKGRMFLSVGAQVTEHTETCAIGCGRYLALGAMHIGATPKQGVEAACKYDLFCSAPIKEVIISLTKGDKNGTNKRSSSAKKTGNRRK